MRFHLAQPNVSFPKSYVLIDLKSEWSKVIARLCSFQDNQDGGLGLGLKPEGALGLLV